MLCMRCGASLPGSAGYCSQCARLRNTEVDGRHRRATVQARQGYEPAGFWLRFLAVNIDTGLIGLFFVIVIPRILGPSFEAEASAPARSTVVFVKLAVVVAALIFGMLLYKPLFERSRLQATPGKLLLGLIVTDSNGERIGFFRALIRYWARALPYLVVIIPMVLAHGQPPPQLAEAICTILFLGNYLMAGLTSDKQAMHDLIASATVRRTSSTDVFRVIAAIGLIALLAALLHFFGGDLEEAKRVLKSIR